MNTRKQVLIMSVLLMLTLIIVGIYGAWYPSRESDAEEEFAKRTSERAAILFARNCRLCHGDVGEGGSLGARLAAAPALDRPDLQGFADIKASLGAEVDELATVLRVKSVTAFKADEVLLIEEERMRVKRVNTSDTDGSGRLVSSELTVGRAFGHSRAAAHAADAAVLRRDPQAFDRNLRESKINVITNTIVCGRVGTGMQPWGQVHGGPLSDEQVRQLTVLITEGRWDLVKDEVDVEDKVSATLLEAVTEEGRFLRVSDTNAFAEGEAIRLGEERLRVVFVPRLPKDAEGNPPKDRRGAIEVQRGALKSSPQEHEPETVIYRFPEPAEPSILQSSCGQTAQPAAPPGVPELIEPFIGQTVEVTALGVAFDKKEISVKSGGRVRVRLSNQDVAVLHNIAFYKSSTELTAVAPGSIGTIFTGPGVDDTAFDVPAPGSYFFRCDVHPTTMTGTFTVTP